MSLQIRKLSHSLGGEISGIDLSKPLDEKHLGAIHKAFLDYSVLLFREQRLTRAQYVGFTRQLGETDDMSVASHTKAQAKADQDARQMDPEFPEIFLNTNQPKAGGLKGFGYLATIWHTDRSHSTTPGMASVLRSVEIPDVGGDTMFANMYLAYDALSDGMKKLIEGLHALHYGGVRTKVDESVAEGLAERKRHNLPVAHPIARVHPETGRKALFIAEKLDQIVGMTKEESKPLLQFLCEHAARPQFSYRHQWRKDDVLMWDNRCTLHMAINDYDRSQVRILERVCIKGQPSGYVFDASVA